MSARFSAAALDRTARVTTWLLWAFALGLIVAGVVALQQGAAAGGAILLGAGGFIAALHAWLRRRQPQAFVVEDGVLRVERRSGMRRFSGPFRNVRRGELGLRVAGDGGGYGYLGRFRAEGRTVSTFVTDRSKVVLLDVGGSALAVSPEDPDGFVVEASRGA
jgi:hypothetical protein